ncbi:unnamed protein product [Spodoptera exigua]|uniref:Dynein axonemal intermediate chain 4 n=1 Tax=Spodoptera exigua TaxID=7107 RepID=A0A835L7E6_SPOEX|nr:hypothetical protein HW555_002027 [Spodoptera exigua]CAH0701581.1 unnamed protein product [Spodoptera exigua]
MVISDSTMSFKHSLRDFSEYVLTTEPTSGKSVKLAPSVVTDKRLLYKVMLNGVDCTPDSITHSSYATLDESLTHAAFEGKSKSRSDAVIKFSRSKSIAGLGGTGVYATTINLDDIEIDHTLNTEEGLQADDGQLSLAPSAFYLPKMNPVTSYPPEILVTLKETETVFLVSLPSLSCDRGSAEGQLVEADNAFYEFITFGKGRNRKMVNQETQTNATTTLTRHTLATRPEKKNAISFASMWDMHDTYAQIKTTQEQEEEDEMVMYQSAASYMLRKKRRLLIEPGKGKAKTFEEIGATPQYMDAVLLTERVLASLEYSAAQKKFRGLVAVDPLSLDLVYVYTLTNLWTFECQETLNKPIIYITFNKMCPNLCATAHGKFGYADVCKGIVCVWCTKNPRKPERLYHFEVPVTSVGFSEKNPNWLACGFFNGDVIILDITSYSPKIIAKSKRNTNPCFEPIWIVSWRSFDRDSEFVMTASQDGRIRRFKRTKTHEFISTPMMRVSAVEGKLKGLETTKPCPKHDVPITRYPAVLCMVWHSTIDHCYLVGTDEGCIHRCSMHYLNQHMDVYRAHAGPVTDMCYSPFMDYLLASCGADNAIRLWIEGMDDVIMTLTCQSAVNGITFCPNNSTILISASGNTLSVWDLRRKTHMPCAEYNFPGDVTLTYISFEKSGLNVFVGDTFGRLHTLHLSDTPIPPFNQKKLLDEAIRKALCTRPKMLKQLDKLLRFRASKVPRM